MICLCFVYARLCRCLLWLCFSHLYRCLLFLCYFSSVQILAFALLFLIYADACFVFVYAHLYCFMILLCSYLLHDLSMQLFALATGRCLSETLKQSIYQLAFSLMIWFYQLTDFSCSDECKMSYMTFVILFLCPIHMLPTNNSAFSSFLLVPAFFFLPRISAVY